MSCCWFAGPKQVCCCCTGCCCGLWCCSCSQGRREEGGRACWGVGRRHGFQPVRLELLRSSRSCKFWHLFMNHQKYCLPYYLACQMKNYVVPSVTDDMVFCVKAFVMSLAVFPYGSDVASKILRVGFLFLLCIWVLMLVPSDSGTIYRNLFFVMLFSKA